MLSNCQKVNIKMVFGVIIWGQTPLTFMILIYSTTELFVTVSVKTHIVCTSMHIEKIRNLEIICEITHATGKYLQESMGPAISEGSFKSAKTIYVPSYSPGYGEF